jgi:large subunit ribosomal protein L32
MGIPSQKRTSSSKKRRASHFRLKKPTFTICKECGRKIKPHRPCLYCGVYKGRKVISSERSERRKKKKAKQPK